MTRGPQQFGVFIAPFHSDRQHPSLQLRQDIELIAHLDRLGYDEAWIGEHHSGAFEIIASPEVFIAAAAEHTSRIRFGTGVSSLPYHHPLLLADRIIQLDHQTQGRMMLGVGPGQLPADAFMMGIDPRDQRRMMHEALDAIVPLMRGEVVSAKTDWFVLDEARCQLLPYDPRRGIDVAVASTFSPTGSVAAGRHGAGLLSVAASTAQGFATLAANWAIYEKAAIEHGHVPDRADWRVVVPMHIAETREQADAEAAHGILDLARYMGGLGGRGMPPWASSAQAAIDQWRGDGFHVLGVATIGTPDDIIATIDRLVDESGGFGTLLFLTHTAATPEATRRSYELFARHVMPYYSGANVNRQASLAWAGSNSTRFIGAMQEAIGNAITEYHQPDATQEPSDADA